MKSSRPATLLFCHLLVLPVRVSSAWAGGKAMEAGGGLINGARENVSLAMALFKVIGALVLVVGLMLLVMNWIRKLGLGRGPIRQGSLIRVLDNRMIAPKKHVAVLDLAGEFVAVGITEQHINLLATLPRTQALTEASREKPGPAPISSFAAILNRAGGKRRKSPDEERASDA